MNQPIPIFFYVSVTWVLFFSHWAMNIYRAKRYIQAWLITQSYVAGRVKMRLPWNSPFSGELFTQSMVYRVEVKDQSQQNFAVWFRVRPTLFGAIKDPEIKFENVHAY